MGVHVPSARGFTHKRNTSPAPKGPGGFSTKYAHLVGQLVVPADKTGVLYLNPVAYPYFQPLKAYIESNTIKLTIRAKVGDKRMFPNLETGHQDISHWIPGGAKGLDRDIAIIVRNHDTYTAIVKVDIAGKPLQEL